MPEWLIQAGVTAFLAFAGSWAAIKVELRWVRSIAEEAKTKAEDAVQQLADHVELWHRKD